MQRQAIAIPTTYTEILCRYCFTGVTTEIAKIEQRMLSALAPGQRMMSELYLVYEGKDDLFYYFYVETSPENWTDNNALIYAR